MIIFIAVNEFRDIIFRTRTIFCDCSRIVSQNVFFLVPRDKTEISVSTQFFLLFNYKYHITINLKSIAE